jgi:D-glycero-alpha-D-manno-heptose 1-phosphate guanylyltransferase
MQALVLAGGFGKRLLSVVADLPKPMADIAGRPFLDYVLTYLSAQGISKVVLAVSYKHEVIQSHVGNAFAGMAVRYSIEDEPRGTGGGIKLALPLIEDEDFLIINGDTFFDVRLKDVLSFHFRARADLTIALKKMDDCSRYGTVETDGEGRVRGFREKQSQRAGLINGGIYCLRKAFLSELPLPPVFSFEKDVMEKEFPTHRVFGAPFDDYFIDIGIPSDYERAGRELGPLCEKYH